MTKRFYIGKQDPEDYLENLEEWITNKIPAPPQGQRCECDKDKHAHESAPDGDLNVEIIDCPQEADTFVYHIKDDHVCYTYVCFSCGEATTNETYLSDYGGEFPTTASGYAVTPRHCST